MRIPGRFNGPPGSANGGYTAGLLAGLLDDPTVQVTLRLPPPLDTDLAARTSPDGVRLYAGEALVAEGVPAAPVPAAVPPVDAAAAAAAARAFPGFTDHPFPTCYVCGPQRPAPDGLGVYPGFLGDGRTAAPFTAPAEVSAPVLWAALDCPGGWSVIGPGRPYVLGRMTATLHRLPAPGEPCVVLGWCAAAEGRKAQVRTSLYGADGALLGAAAATWIAVPPS
ncbi:hypothetical protein GCM10010124_07620 [Pilimelia terevasa]|uniref:Thioesterase family protein n=1 Tax=Pilimelia terevasa TaxID=53372 RepID=A0A8J3BGC8_9ACTN|nr:hypothetical protein [Pilimelia terevasa]GGK17552.1 hypothetical protein GCM10010124_07620 [Pilimelia terevasa]